MRPQPGFSRPLEALIVEGGGRQSREALGRSLTDNISLLWRHLNLKNEQRPSSDLEAGKNAENRLAGSGQKWEISLTKFSNVPGRQADLQSWR